MRGIIKRGFDWPAGCLSLWHVVLTASGVVHGNSSPLNMFSMCRTKTIGDGISFSVDICC
jgi:hypothetical protein